MNAEELEASIVAAPDDRDAYQVYGDWLSENGDPLGELVNVQVALEKKPRDRTLLKREEALVDEHRDTCGLAHCSSSMKTRARFS